MSFCTNCGATVPEGNKFCSECGQLVGSAVGNAGTETPPEAPVESSGYGDPSGNWDPAQYDYRRYEQQYQQPNYQQPNYQQYQQADYQQYQQYQYQQYQPPVPPSGTAVGSIYSKSFALLARKPVRLWGLSLMFTLLSALAAAFGVIPIISLPITFVLEVGMTSVFLDAYRGKDVSTDQLFKGFKNFFRFAGGMAWMYLWVLIWSMIPIAGIVFGVIKSYSYRFVPYILLSDPDISATEALRVSMRLTEGYKGKMFLADLLLGAIIFVVVLIFTLIGGAVPVLLLLTVIVWAVVVAFAPLVFGIIKAAYYDEIEKEKK